MLRLWLAIQSFCRVLANAEFAEKVNGLKQAEPGNAIKPGINQEFVRGLALLQREGRLVDFLREDIQAYNDAQIGAAVRSVHRGCRKVLDDYLVFEPILREQEGSVVTVQAGFDPSVIRLVGEVAGNPPFRGTLKHHGWRVSQTSLPEVPEGQDRSIVAAAEVELA